MSDDNASPVTRACRAPRQAAASALARTPRFGLTQVQTDSLPAVRHRQRRREKQRRCASIADPEHHR